MQGTGDAVQLAKCLPAVVSMRMAPIGSSVGCLALSGTVWGSIRRCGLIGGSVSLEVDFEVSKAHNRPRPSLSAPSFQIRCKLTDAMLPAMMVIE